MIRDARADELTADLALADIVLVREEDGRAVGSIAAALSDPPKVFGLYHAGDSSGAAELIIAMRDRLRSKGYRKFEASHDDPRMLGVFNKLGCTPVRTVVVFEGEI